MIQLAGLMAIPVSLMIAVAPGGSILNQAFGNTVVETYPDGRTAELWMTPTGDYTAMGRTGNRSSGRWSVKGGKVCLNQKHPWLPFSYCTPLPAATSWTAKAPTGEWVQVRLVLGISTNPGPA